VQQNPQHPCTVDLVFSEQFTKLIEILGIEVITREKEVPKKIEKFYCVDNCY